MSRTILLLLLAALVGVFGCRDGLGTLLESAGAAPIREISAGEARALLDGEDITIVQPLPRDPSAPRLPDAAWLSPEDPVPEAWRSSGQPILVVGEADAAMALAARLARAGAGSLAVVTGDLEALAEQRTARQR